MKEYSVIYNLQFSMKFQITNSKQNTKLKIKNSKFRTETGKIGEDIAKEYLKKKGYNIKEENYKTKYGETDLIAMKENILVFVEVRTKTGERFGAPEQTINKMKINKLRRNALAYATIKKWKGPYRIDAVCIVLNQDHTINRLDHYENIC